MSLASLETPCLVLDRKKLRKNLAGMRERADRLGVALRPHGKTAKNTEIMGLTLGDRSEGITVSTLKEAEYYLENGIVDMTYAVGIEPGKLDRIARLMADGARLSVVVDSVEQVRAVAAQARRLGLDLPARIELDSDGHRSGIPTGDAELLAVGECLEREGGLHLTGVLTHAGESYHCRSTEEIRAVAETERQAAVDAAKRLRNHGLPCPVVSVGSTPTAVFAEHLSGVTELRAGVYMFYDLVMAGLGVCAVDDIAVSVLASVIGYQKSKNWLITDAGWMALSRDRGTASQEVDQGYGLVCDVDGRPIDDLIVSGANQEHGILTSRSGKPLDWTRFPIGEKIRILPNHACATAAQYDRYQVIDGDSDDGDSEIVDVWHRINGW